MQQVLFNIPLFKSAFPPDGIPVYGFGAMLFVTFILVTWWGDDPARPIGMPPARFQDFVIWVFVSGIIGARVLYMIQYANQFPDKSILGLLGAFFRIWEGGIVFYGSALGGAIGYGLFYWFVMRRLNISGWQLADAVAPLLALGLAIGRIGCYLNGCCWGQVACETCPVPLGAAHFPLLPAHARSQLVAEEYLQTSTGFAIAPRTRASEDPRAVVTVVERGSPADKAGVKPGDRIVKVNGEPNRIIVDVSGDEDKVKSAFALLKDRDGVRRTETPSGRNRVEFDQVSAYRDWRSDVEHNVSGVDLSAKDRLEELARDWPRGKSQLTLAVERNGQIIDLPPFLTAHGRPIPYAALRNGQHGALDSTFTRLLPLSPSRWATDGGADDRLRHPPVHQRVAPHRTDLRIGPHTLAMGEYRRVGRGCGHRDLLVVRNAIALGKRHFHSISGSGGDASVNASPAGYSGTPLWKKLGLREDTTVLTVNAPRCYRKLLAGLPKGVTFVTEANPPVEFVHLFVDVARDFAATASNAADRTRTRWHALGLMAQEVIGSCHRYHRGHDSRSGAALGAR